MTCDPATNGFQVSGNYGSSYVLGQDGEELTQLGANGTWQRTNVFADGRQLATYDGNGLHFQITDPLGTRRMQTSDVGQPETDIQSLPFGDGLAAYPDQYAPSTADDATPLHFTGKERDPETGEANGNDYFGARYYTSSMGRFLIPDWSAKVESVPYARIDNPQTLNLYAYLQNNPLAGVDADGHCANKDEATCAKITLDMFRNNMEAGAAMNAEAAQPLAWSSLSGAQQSVLSGGQKAWSGMSADAQDNYAAITNALGEVKLSDGATGLSEIDSASMRADGREMNVTWAQGAEKAFQGAGFHEVGDSLHHGTSFKPKGMRVEGLHLVFPSQRGPESQVHIDYRSGLPHFGRDNDDVIDNEEKYRQWYGPLPGLIP